MASREMKLENQTSLVDLGYVAAILRRLDVSEDCLCFQQFMASEASWEERQHCPRKPLVTIWLNSRRQALLHIPDTSQPSAIATGRYEGCTGIRSAL